MAKKRSTKKTAHLPENIMLHDSAGRLRVVLGMIGNDDWPTLQLNDSEGRNRVTIQLEPTGRATIGIQDANGSGLIGLSADPSGRIGFSMRRPGGIPILEVAWSERQGLSTSVWDDEGKPVWRAGNEPGPPVRDSELRKGTKDASR